MKSLKLKVFIFFVFFTTGVSFCYAQNLNSPESLFPGNQPVMSKEQKEMQERMRKYSVPNANHEFLKSLVGSWKGDVKYWMDSKADSSESEGRSDNRMIMGGRFLEENFSSNLMGQFYEGRGVYGYDGMHKEFTGIWFDSTSTSVMISSAHYNPSTKIFTEVGNISNLFSEEYYRSYKAVTALIDEGHYSYELFLKDQDGREYKSMSIIFTRLRTPLATFCRFIEKS